MRRLLILFVMLYIFHLCYCETDHYEKCFNEPDIIYLFETVNMVEINTDFENRLYDILDGFTVQRLYVDGMTLPQALRTIDISSEKIAIHLYLQDFYKHNYAYIKERGFRLAADVQRPRCQDTPEDMLNDGEDECTSIQENSTILVSKSIDNFPRLLDFVNEYWDNNDNDRTPEVCQPMVIVKCVDNAYESTSTTIMHKKIRIDTTPSCETYNFHNSDMIIAVLAPKPFILEDKLEILTIFYDQLEVDVDLKAKDTFQNGISIIRKEEKLENAFMRVMQMMKWNRIGIISDDSPICKEFEEKMTSLFDKNDVIYGSKSCDVGNCDYYEVLTPIMMSEPRIVIANLAEENARTFADAAAKWNKTIVWLVRNWSPQTARAVVMKLDHVISIAFGLMPRNDNNNIYNFPHEPRNLNILMNVIKNENFLRYYESFEGVKTEFRKMIHMEQKNTCAYANWYWSHRTWFQTAEARIDMYNRVEDNKWDSKTPAISSDVNDCLITSGVYFYPCNDIEFMLLMLVLSIFALSVLGIVYFYDVPEEQAVRVREYARMAH